MSWVLLAIIAAVILVVTAFYSVSQQERFIREFTTDIREVLDEAVLVKKDLEAAMENALLVSQKIASTLDEKLDRLKQNQEKPFSQTQQVTKPHPKPPRPALPFSIEELRRAHPYLVVPRLYEQGLEVAEIAELLGCGKGEVRLVLNLHRKKEACS